MACLTSRTKSSASHHVANYGRCIQGPPALPDGETTDTVSTRSRVASDNPTSHVMVPTTYAILDVRSYDLVGKRNRPMTFEHKSSRSRLCDFPLISQGPIKFNACNPPQITCMSQLLPRRPSSTTNPLPLADSKINMLDKISRSQSKS